MSNFETIMDSIEKKLEELRRINEELMWENMNLKKQLAQSTKSTVSFVSVDDAFKSIFSKLSSTRQITLAYTAVKNHGFENICDLKGVQFYEWDDVGLDSATVIALLLKHYGIKPEMPHSKICKYRYELLKNYYYFK